MGITKSNIYTEEQNQVAAYAKVLGHPARIAIIQELVERKTCVCGDLVNEIGLAQATISQHLKELKQAELIQGEVEGTSVCYCINEKNGTNLKPCSVVCLVLSKKENLNVVNYKIEKL